MGKPRKQINARCESEDGGYWCRLIPVDVLAQFGQWCITHPPMRNGGVAVDSFVVTHELVGWAAIQPTFDKRMAIAVASALKPYEFLSLQDPRWERDRCEMGQTVQRAIADYKAAS